MTMLSNIVAATINNGRQYCTNNHCEYMEMAIEPSPYEAYATRTFVIDDSLQDDNVLLDMPDVRHPTAPHTAATPANAPPSICTLLGIGVFDLTGTHTAHMLYLAQKSAEESALHASQSLAASQSKQEEIGEKDAGEDDLLVPDNMV